MGESGGEMVLVGERGVGFEEGEAEGVEEGGETVDEIFRLIVMVEGEVHKKGSGVEVALPQDVEKDVEGRDGVGFEGVAGLAAGANVEGGSIASTRVGENVITSG